MRTTVTLDEELVAELQGQTGARTKTEAVAFAVREQIRRSKMRKLASLLGRVRIDEETIRRGDRDDLARAVVRTTRRRK